MQQDRKTNCKGTNLDKLIPPIIIVGTNRSGKSLLARCFSYLDRVYWWPEPNAVWRIGNAYGAHDRRCAIEATKRIRTTIRRHYLRRQRAQGNKRIIDDSPLHCISVPFVRSVFPEAKLIHVFRDGRDVICDLLESWQKPFYSFERNTLLCLITRLKQNPISRWPAYVRRGIGGLTNRALNKNATRQRHGVRYPGIKQDFRALSNVELACKLWRICQEYALDDLTECPRTMCIHVAYESLVSRPASVLAEILAFLEEPVDDSLLRNIAEQITPAHVGKWHMLFDKKTQDHLFPFLEPTLSRVEKLIREQQALIV